MPRRTDGIRLSGEEGRNAERLIALFVFGVILFSPPFLTVFDVAPEVLLFGFPVVVLYLFAVWALLIALLIFCMRDESRQEKESEETLSMEKRG